MPNKPQSTTEPKEAPERIWIAPTTIKKREGRIYTAPGRRDNEIEYVRVHALSSKESEVDEPDIYDLVAEFRDRMMVNPVCVHCELPIALEQSGWIHVGSELVTCRRIGLAKHDGVFRAAPATASAAPVVGHHKHCSSWTVTTSGEKKSCDCVCECSHTMFEHIRPGEHAWYEDCAADGCPCMKFTAAATAAPQQSRSNHFPDEALNKGFPDHISRDGTAYYSDGTVLPPTAAPVEQPEVRHCRTCHCGPCDEHEYEEISRGRYRCIRCHSERFAVGEEELGYPSFTSKDDLPLG